MPESGCCIAGGAILAALTRAAPNLSGTDIDVFVYGGEDDFVEDPVQGPVLGHEGRACLHSDEDAGEDDNGDDEPGEPGRLDNAAAALRNFHRSRLISTGDLGENPVRVAQRSGVWPRSAPPCLHSGPSGVLLGRPPGRVDQPDVDGPSCAPSSASFCSPPSCYRLRRRPGGLRAPGVVVFDNMCSFLIKFDSFLIKFYCFWINLGQHL